MAVTNVFAGIPVSNYESARGFYERLFGRPPDMTPHATEACWQFTDTGWIYVVEDRERAGRGTVTLLVDDLDRLADELTRRGLDFDRKDEPVRKVSLVDVDGNGITFGQP